MCGRINVSSDPLAELYLELLDQPFPGPDRYNVAPTEPVSVITNRAGPGLALVEMRWWLTPYWSKEVSTRYSMFNAKAETLEQSRAFAEPFRRRRCVVPVSGFYEWVREGGRRLPYYLRPAANDGLLLAGIWDRWRGGEAPLESFAIVTTAASERLKFVHDRQPVMLRREDLDTWLAEDAEPGRLRELTGSALPSSLAAIPVSTYVNNSRNEGPRCIEAVGDAIELVAGPLSGR